MFDIFEMLNTGRKFEAHGKEWVLLKVVFEEIVLAAEANQALPCPVYLVEMPSAAYAAIEGETW